MVAEADPRRKGSEGERDESGRRRPAAPRCTPGRQQRRAGRWRLPLHRMEFGRTDQLMTHNQKKNRRFYLLEGGGVILKH